MNLTAAQRSAIAAGRKTEHRVPADGGTRTWQRYRTINGERRYYGPVEERPRQTLPPVGTRIALGDRRRAVVLEIEESVTLTEPSRTVAKAEGYGNAARAVLDFKRDFLTRHDDAWVRRESAVEQGLTDEALAARFTSHHVGRRIHVVHLAPAEAVDEYMGRTGRGGPDGSSYVESVGTAIDPASVPPRDYVDRLADAAAGVREDQRSGRDAERKRARVPRLRDRARGWDDEAA